MILELFEAFGLNRSLFVDLGAGFSLFMFFVFSLIILQFNGIFIPLVKSKLRKQNIAIVDLGGIETPLLNYPRGANELVWENKGNKYSWTIPAGIEREFPNHTRYILVNTKLGAGFNAQSHEEVKAAAYLEASGEAINISMAAELLNRVRVMLSPKVQANTIDDRAKQLAEVEAANMNKPLIYGVAIAIVAIVMIGLYLIITKAMEYSVCSEAVRQVANIMPPTTLPPLKPI